METNVDSLIGGDLAFEKYKNILIEEALKLNDKLALKTYAISSFGFINNSLRTRVWFKLINLNDKKSFFSYYKNIILSNEFDRQVALDVERSLKRFPPSVKEEKRILYQDSLTKLIIRILNENPTLHYYQGYHDICLTFLLIMDEENAFHIVNRVSLTHLKHFMERTMNTTSNLLEIIYLVLKNEDVELHEYLLKSEVGTIFCLSWVITWFSHVLGDLNDILRLFDFFISSHFLMPIYLTISILRYKRQDILKIDCDMASMHKYLSSIPEQEPLPFDKLIYNSLILSIRHPPEETLEKQKLIETNILKEDKSLVFKLLNFPFRFFSHNFFSITFFGLISFMIYQFYVDNFYAQ